MSRFLWFTVYIYFDNRTPAGWPWCHATKYTVSQKRPTFGLL